MFLSIWPFAPWILVKQNAKGGRNKGTRNYHYPKSHLNVQIYETVDLAERKTDCTGNNKRDYSNCNFMAIRAKSHQILNHKKIKKNLKELPLEQTIHLYI